MKNDNKNDRYLTDKVATGRTGRTKRRAKIVRISILVLSIILLCLLFLTLALPHFLVKEVSVKGAGRYTAEELVALSNIKIGEEILAVDMNSAIDAILKNCPYVHSVSVTVHLSGKVVLNVVEEKDLMYAEEDGIYVSFSRSFSVLEIKESAEAFSDFLYVELPVMTSLRAGGRVRFASGDEWAKEALLSLVERLKKSSYGDKLTKISVKNEREVYYVLDGKCKVILGEMKELDEKEALLEGLFKQKGGIPQTPTTFDLRDPKKIIETPGI